MRVFTLLGLLVLPAIAGVPTKMPDDREKGRQIWRESCWQCHGWTGEGSGPVAAELPTPSPPLAGRVAEADYDRLIAVIQDGAGDMPAYSAMLDSHDARRVLVWLASLDKDNPKDDGDDAKAKKADAKSDAKTPRARPVPPKVPAPVEEEAVEQEGGGP